MEQRLLPIGIQDFSEIINKDFVYVDKTELVYRMTHTSGKALFLSRPRRFGKSLLCSTLRYYFEGRRELFRGLAIEKLETEWKQYPVFHFDISQCKEGAVELVCSRLDSLLAGYERDYNLDSSMPSFGGRLERLIKTAYEKTGNQAVLIFDEYDSVMLSALNDPEKMEQVRGIFNSFFGPVKFMDKYLRFVFITGITKFSQMSIFSTINNLRNISMDEQWESICGITARELEANFADRIALMGEKNEWTAEQTMARLRDNYDGYHFSKALTDIYNPFSIINALSDYDVEDYWFGSATPTALIETLRYYEFDPNTLEGVTVQSVGFDQPFDYFDDAVPILYQSGYLTIKDYDRETREYTLGIPNGEVRRGLYYTLMRHYLGASQRASNNVVMNIKRAVCDNDIDKVLEALKVYLASLPHHLSNKTEQDFETILRVLFNGIGTEVDTEVQNAVGRCDVVLKNAGTIYVLELKTSKNSTVDEALAQIDEKNYLIPYWNDPRRKVKVGVVVDTETRTISDWKVVK